MSMLIIILIVLGILWYYYISQRFVGDTDNSAVGTDTGAYQRVKDLKLDVALFVDPVFRELKQETIPPPPTESIGRSNPFLPF